MAQGLVAPFGGPWLLVDTGSTQVAGSDNALIARSPDYEPRRVIALITSSAPEGDLFFEVGDGHKIPILARFDYLSERAGARLTDPYPRGLDQRAESCHARGGPTALLLLQPGRSRFQRRDKRDEAVPIAILRNPLSRVNADLLHNVRDDEKRGGQTG